MRWRSLKKTNKLKLNKIKLQPKPEKQSWESSEVQEHGRLLEAGEQRSSSSVCIRWRVIQLLDASTSSKWQSCHSQEDWGVNVGWTSTEPWWFGKHRQRRKHWIRTAPEGYQGGACCEMQGAMYMDRMIAWAVPRIHLESLANRGQEEKVVGKEMIEICQNLDLLCSNLTVETGLTPSVAFAWAANCAVLLSLAAGVHQHQPPRYCPWSCRIWGHPSGALRETMWLCFLKRLVCHPYTGRSCWPLLTLSWTIFKTSLKCQDQLKLSPEAIVSKCDYLQVTQAKQGKKMGHFPETHFPFHVH